MYSNKLSDLLDPYRNDIELEDIDTYTYIEQLKWALQQSIEHLHLQEERRHRAFNECPIPLLITTTSGRIVDANPPMLDFLGAHKLDGIKYTRLNEYTKNNVDLKELYADFKNNSKPIKCIFNAKDKENIGFISFSKLLLSENYYYYILNIQLPCNHCGYFQGEG